MDNKYTWTYMSDTFKDMYKATNVQCIDSDEECYNMKYSMDNLDITDVTAEEGLNQQLSDICPLNNDPQLCCDSSQRNSGEVINVLDYEKVKPTYDEQGNLTKVEVCNCGRFLDDRQRQECVDEYCNNFRDPTIYETCKIDDGNINPSENTMDALLIGTGEETDVVTIEESQFRPDCETASCSPLIPSPPFPPVPPVTNGSVTTVYEPTGTSKTVSLVVLGAAGIFFIVTVVIIIITVKKRKKTTF
jgi:hypothetical protein